MPTLKRVPGNEELEKLIVLFLKSETDIGMAGCCAIFFGTCTIPFLNRKGIFAADALFVVKDHNKRKVYSFSMFYCITALFVASSFIRL